MYICPRCGSNRIRNAKVLGYEDEMYCSSCGAFSYHEEVIRVYDSATSDASKAPGSASSAGASPLGEFLDGLARQLYKWLEGR